ncbi:cysteine-rich receptor-like protein kinase 15 isoform X1 [Apium graveolens]|uniref:cysteine-rich receptor-like protein kinase 15 isoform X1 n=2 Tax=Apium graveolens TaxID=4045 RepID=UPI003D7C00F2
MVCFLAIVMIHNFAEAQIQYVYSSCQDNTTASANYTAGSQFEKNLNSLLYRTLYINGGGSISNYSTEGSHPDDVYGLFLCRGDVSAKTCQDCIDAATSKILSDCPYKKQAIIWYDQCLIRYSDTSFNATMITWPSFCLFNAQNFTETKNFSRILRDMFSNLTDQATNIPANRKYAKTQVPLWDFKTLYGMVQCTPDLSPSQCRKCLSSIYDSSSICSVEGTRGRRILTPSCNTRYEIYSFLSDPPSTSPASGNRTDNGTNGRTKSKTLGITIGTTLSATLVIVLIVFCKCYYNRRKRTEELDHNPGEQLLDLTEDNYLDESFDAENKVKSNKFPLIRLSLIQTATQQFSIENKLGEGGFGPVYKGTLADGKEIAVKRLSRNSGQGLQEFKAEVTLIAKLQHKNLVKLLGCCLEGRELLLVYDYMPNKSLDVHLFDSTMGDRLDWTTRLNIINGIARGILYLHEDSRLRIIHRDLKASNILLDHDMNPKVSDFGMARIFSSNQIEANTNRVVGTYGYMAPEYAMEGIFSVKSDVFSFGVLLLEMVSGKKNSGFHLAGHGHSLLTYAWKLWTGGQGLELMDPRLRDTCIESEVLKCVQIGLLCVQEDPADRPTMSSVIHMLGSYSIALPQPTEPAFSVGRAVPFSQQQTVDSVSSVSSRQVTPSSHVKSDEIEPSVSIGDLTVTDSVPR